MGKTPPEIDANKDRSVDPGDSFFDFCNGSWLKATPYPATGAVGGKNNAIEPMARLLLNGVVMNTGPIFGKPTSFP